MDPSNMEYGRGKWHAALLAEVKSVVEGSRSLKNTETAMDILADDEPANYNEAMQSTNSEQWKKACEDKYEILEGYCT